MYTQRSRPAILMGLLVILVEYSVRPSAAQTTVNITEPGITPAQALLSAQQYQRNGVYDRALQVVHAGLQRTPKHRGLLDYQADLLFEMHDYEGTMRAQRALLRARPRLTARERQVVQDYIRGLRKTRRTKLQLQIVGGPATVYLDRRQVGPICVASETCERNLVPGKPYEVIVERRGFAVFRQRVRLKNRQTLTLRVPLQELSSTLSVDIRSPVDAEVKLDGRLLGVGSQSVGQVSAGTHRVDVSARGFETRTLDVQLALGRPERLQVALAEQVPVHIQPAALTCELWLDQQPVTLDQEGRLRLPPGSKRLVARADGYREAEVALDERMPRTTIKLSLQPEPSPRPEIPRWSTRKKVAVATIGGTAIVGLALSVGHGVSSVRWLRRALPVCDLQPSGGLLCPTEQGKADHERSRSHMTRANRFLVTGLALSAMTLGVTHLGERPPSGSRWSWHRTLSLAGTGALSAGSAVLGIRLSLRARQHRRQVSATCRTLMNCLREEEVILDQAAGDADNATLAFALAGVSAGVSALLLTTLPRRLEVIPSVLTDSVQLTVGGRF